MQLAQNKVQLANSGCVNWCNFLGYSFIFYYSFILADALIYSGDSET